ncbi:MEDS domain-containing protein [Alkaliphilus metalliredigens]|uniref:MEDS domain-containing protein n=1 Tax=Alkaliphilus metalliredigens TaxID=208226 RepID=UPI0002ECA3F9|nr:MEDS domain-containing protein [Alkaliphilus metalliredigens]
MVMEQLSNEFQGLSFGDHICLLYNDMDGYRKIAIDYITKGLSNNEKVICLTTIILRIC